MSQVETVSGPVNADKLGVTLSHEHVLVVMGEDNHHYPWMFDLDATREKAIREVREAKAGGIDTIIDLTTPDLGRDVEFVRDGRRGVRHEHRRGHRNLARCAAFVLVTRHRQDRRHLRPRDRGGDRHDQHQGGRHQGSQRCGGRDTGGGARAARRRAGAEAHGMSDQHAPLGAGARRHAASGDLPGGRRSDGSHLHRTQRRHNRCRLPRIAAAHGRVPLDGSLSGRGGAARLAAAKRNGEGADRSRLGASPDAGARLRPVARLGVFAARAGGRRSRRGISSSRQRPYPRWSAMGYSRKPST